MPIDAGRAVFEQALRAKRTKPPFTTIADSGRKGRFFRQIRPKDAPYGDPGMVDWDTDRCPHNVLP
jgi:hypothetical protein